MSRPVGTVVLWPGRGVYRIIRVTLKDGQTCVWMDGLEGQGIEVDVPAWKLYPVMRPLETYPPIPKEAK